MHRTSTGGQGIGIALVVIGAVLLLMRATSLHLGTITGYLTVVALGAALIVASLVLGKDRAGLAVPGSVLATVGAILIAQQWLGRYDTWAYAWALLPVGAGIGRVLEGTSTGDEGLVREGWRSAGVGLTLFLAVGLVFELFVFGTYRSNFMARIGLPVALIAVGAVLLLGRGGSRRRAPG